MDYYCEYFDYDHDFMWFDKFKRIVRENYKLWDSWDPLDFEAMKKICSPKTCALYDVAEICYQHVETALREIVMNSMEMAETGEPIKLGVPEDKISGFTRGKAYYSDGRVFPEDQDVEG